MLRVANRVKESTLTSGSGTIALAGASNGYQSFSSVLSNGDTSYYTIVNGDSWEVGIGTYSSNTLSRDVVLSSSNSNNKLDLNGQSYVFIAYPSEKSVYKDQNNQVVVGSSGVIIESGVPSNTSSVLYNTSGVLYFNGVPVHTSEAYSLVTTVFNRSSSAIPKFSVVYISGGQGDLPVIALAIANSEDKSSKTFGITQESIPAMDSGHVVSYGNINKLDTDYYNPNAPHGDINGRILYLSPTISGGLTLDKPHAPYNMVALGTVIRTHQNEGVFNVRIQNGFELEELHNVATTGAISGQFLKFDGSLWRNTGITSLDIKDFSSAVSGISPNISISGTSGISVDKNGNNYTVYTTGTFGLSSSQVQSLLNSGVSIYVTSGTGNFSSLSVGGIGVSLSGHTHTSSNITNFNSSVSGLLPSVSGSGYASVGFSNNIYTVSVTGLQPTGNYSISGHTHTSSDITNFNSSVSGLLGPYALLSSGNFTTLYVTGIPVSLSDHTHNSSQITDFNSSVNGLLPVKNISGSGYVVVSSSGGSFTVGVTGLQPSGNYSVSGHQHNSSDIINFNSSVSGLLTPYALLNSGNFTTLFVTNVPVSLSGHLHTSSQITDFNSSVSGLLPVKNINGSGYVVVSSSGGTFTVGVTGLQPSGNYSISGHTHTASSITDFNSATSGLLTPYALLNSGNFTNLFVTGTPVSLSGHTHVSSQITDFNTSVSGLLPFTGVIGSGNINISSSNRILSISTTGLQPSGNYSVSGHSHTVSDISDFGSGVSGLLPVKDLLPGTNVTIASNSGIYTINASGGGGGSSVSISSPGSDRVLTSDGTSSGIIGQSGLTFTNNRLIANGVIINNGNNLYMWSNFR